MGSKIKYKNYKNQADYRRDLNIRRGNCLVEVTRQLEWFANSKGFKTYQEYLDILAISRGFTCYDEYYKAWEFYPKMPNPLYEDRSNIGFIGYLAEIGIFKIYDNIKVMQNGNPGYDCICPKGFKIDIKGALLNIYNRFAFHIRKNKIADYFVLVGIDNDIINILPLYIWMIKGDEIIQKTPINSKNVLSISNDDENIELLRKYELTDKLDKLKEVCAAYNNAQDIIELNEREILNKIDKEIMMRQDILKTSLASKFRKYLKIIPMEEMANYSKR